jgi:CheY-like chemotaxis protein
MEVVFMTAQCMSNVKVSTKQILVIDDESNVREVVGACLKSLGGWTVQTASSGYEGLAIAQSTPPDAILLDIMMPGLDGFTVLERLKENPTTQGIPVILLTANTYISEPQVRTLGVKAAIFKPFEPLSLIRKISEALDWN